MHVEGIAGALGAAIAALVFVFAQLRIWDLRLDCSF
jgi:hypothetical protein